MLTLHIKLSGRPLMASITQSDSQNAPELGSQYDNHSARFVFSRPEENGGDHLLLFFDDGAGNFGPVNLGAENEFIVSDYLTQGTCLRMQAAFERDGAVIAHSNVVKFSLRESLKPGCKIKGQPPGSVSRLIEKAITAVSYENNVLLLHNFSGERVGSVRVSKYSPYIGENGNWRQWSEESGDYEDTGVVAAGAEGPRGAPGDKGDGGDKGEKGEQGAPGAPGEKGERGPEGPQGEAGPQGKEGPAGPQGLSGSQNLLINGALQIWQRGTSFTNPNNTYTADRMKCTGGVVSRTSANGGMTVTGATTLRYIMEDLDYAQIAGQTVTLSYLRNGSVVTDTYLSSRYSSVTGGRIVIELSLSNCALGWIKLELGDKATPFAVRPIAEELALCQRYYEVGMWSYAVPGSVLSSYWYRQPYKVTKRISPDVSHTVIEAGNAAANISNSLDQNEIEFRMSVVAIGSRSHAIISWTAAAEL